MAADIIADAIKFNLLCAIREISDLVQNFLRALA
jgi:hypothetical protein